MEELISVVIPAYNIELYLDNCLASVLSQTYSEIEVILIDDGSTDNTLLIAKRYQKEFPGKIRVFHTKNRGVTMARLFGIKEAKGEWIGFVDGDDEIEPDMFERLYANAKKYGADISHCGHRTIVNGGERIHDFYNTGRLIIQDTEGGLRDLLDGPIEPSLCTKLFRKCLLQDLVKRDVIDTTIKYNEDLLMNYYLFQESNKSVYEDFCGYHYMARSSSATRKSFQIERVLDPVKVWGLILKSSEDKIADYAWRQFITVCANAYVYMESHPVYKDKAGYYRDLLTENIGKWRLLSCNGRVKVALILLSPKLYKRLFRFYQRHFQKKVYE